MTTTVDEFTDFVSLRRSDVLTRTIERKKPQADLYDVAFAPLTPYPRTSIELVIRTGYGAGLAAFKADNANTPSATFAGALQRQVIDLVTIAEKDTLNASDLKRLQSTDPNTALEAATTIVDKTMQLRHRNINRSRWMAWQAVKGSLAIAYPTGSTLTVDYDLDGDRQNADFSSTHLPTVSTSWANAAADIIGDVQTWATLIADDLGGDEKNVRLHVSTAVWRYMQNNTAIKAKLSAFQPRLIAPIRVECADIFGIEGVVEVNDFYWDGTTKNRFLPTTAALLTYVENGKYQYGGEDLMQLLDGLVVKVVNGNVVVETNPGLQADMYVNEDQAALNIRVQSARIPVMQHPAGFVYATVVV